MRVGFYSRLEAEAALNAPTPPHRKNLQSPNRIYFTNGDKKVRKGKKQWGVVTSCRPMDAALVLDDLTTIKDHCLCIRDGITTCTHVAQSVCLQVLYDMHTQTGTYFGEGAQLSAQENK